MENLKIEVFKTVGYSHFDLYLAKAKKGNYELIAKLSSQYGWEDGCKEHIVAYVKYDENFKVTSCAIGNECMLGYANINAVKVEKEDYTVMHRLYYKFYKNAKENHTYSLYPNEAEKLGLIKSSFPKGKQRTFNTNLARKGQIVYWPIKGSNKYYKSFFNEKNCFGYECEFMKPLEINGTTIVCNSIIREEKGTLILAEK